MPEETILGIDMQFVNMKYIRTHLLSFQLYLTKEFWLIGGLEEYQ